MQSQKERVRRSACREHSKWPGQTFALGAMLGAAGALAASLLEEPEPAWQMAQCCVSVCVCVCVCV